MITVSGYTLKERIHAGFQSEVYRGISDASGLPIVIKLLNRPLPTHEEISRFRTEFEITRSLSVEGVIKVYELVPVRNTLALVLEDMGGTSIMRLLDEGQMAISRVLDVASKTAAALVRVHAHDVTHKDLNPSNVVFNADTGDLRIIDFGLATDLSAEEALSGDPDLLEGTLAYISPEQTGRMNRTVDYRTDLYSFGATLFHMITGRMPFVADDAMELVHAHIAREPANPRSLRPECPEPLAEIVLTLMAKTADDRYQSAQGLLSDLEVCREQFDSTGSAGMFVLGRDDRVERFQIPGFLYGRDEERRELSNAFERVAAHGSELVLVTGEPGSGKSALVSELQRPIAKRRAYFAEGKCDQYTRGAPYNGVITAFQDLIRQLLAESTSRLDRWRGAFAEALGRNGQVIVDVIPEFEHLIGTQEPLPKLGTTEAQHRFELTFRQLIGVLATAEHPLVLFLDDLQWADSASLRLTKLLLKDSAHLLVIGAYRDGDVGPGDPLVIGLQEIGELGVRTSEIAIGDLERADVAHLLADTLHRSASEVDSLAGLVLAKTRGNPFFLTRFVEALHRDGLLTYDRKSFRWEWVEDSIVDRDITDNVVELVTDGIKLLDEPVVEVLKMASCLGGRFNLRTLAAVSELEGSSLANCLKDASRAGLIVPIGNSYRIAASVDPGESLSDLPEITYKFVHDRVQQAAYLLVPDDVRQSLHLRIGRHLLGRLTAEELEERIFEVTGHLNRATDLIESPDERAHLSDLNLAAAHRARKSAAYETAAGHFAIGYELLPPASWEVAYDSTLAFCSGMTEACLLSTDFDRMEQFSAIVLSQAKGVLDKVPVYEVLIQYHVSQHRIKEAVHVAFEVLAHLGVHLPRHPKRWHTAIGFLRTALSLRGKTETDLDALPEMTDPKMLAAVRIMITSFSAFYNASTELAPLIIFRLINASLKYGSCPGTALAFVYYGVILCGIRRIDAGYRFGTYGMGQIEKFNAVNMKPLFDVSYYSSVLPWREHFSRTFEPLKDSYKTAIETGNFEYAALSSTSYAHHLYVGGVDLPDVEAAYEQYIKQLTKLRQETMLDTARMGRQVALNLMDRADDPRRLVGEALDEDDAIPRMEKADNRNGLCFLHAHKIELNFLFRDYESAISAAKVNEKYLVSVLGHSTVPFHHFYARLAEIATYKSQTPWARLLTTRRAAATLRRLKYWAKHAPANYEHKFELLHAEFDRIRGRPTAAMRRYDRALDAARRNGITGDEAMAGELAAAFYLDCSMERTARAYLVDAHHAYMRWGAAAKVRDLEERFGQLLTLETVALPAPDAISGRGTYVSSATTDTSQLDLATVMKSARIISGEIVLEKLLRKLMRVLIENVGAQRGVLVLAEKDGLFVEAESSVEADDVRLLQSVPLEAYGEISVGIINYAARLREHVVLADAHREGRFTTDEYIQRNSIRSVLCLPLMNKGALTGLVYLENNLASDAFTDDRLELLRLISGEMAISIENARLYTNLEMKVEERTRELRESNRQLDRAYKDLKATQAQLVQSEKLASLGQLTAGVAHEIKNPLNFINNFADTVSDMVSELGEELEASRGKQVSDVIEEMLSLVEELRTATDIIQKHGARADGIVTSMMQHARDRRGTMGTANLNDLLREFVNLSYHGMRAQQPDLDVKIETTFDENVGEIMMASQDIGRVFVNILTNAYHAVAERKEKEADYKPLIRVETADKGNEVEVRISDNGPGIPPKIRDKIFEPFFTTKPTGQGTGLGLSLSYDIIVQQHGGSLRAESEIDQGTAFIIRLPNGKRTDSEQAT